MRKRITGAVLLLLCPIWLAGCAGREGNTAESPQSTDDVVKGTIITSYIQQSNSPASVWKGWGAARLYEDTGLILESFSAEGQTAVELKLRLSSGNVPDIIGFSDKEQAQLYVDAGLLLPLNEYREYLPSLFEGEVYREALEWAQTAGGGEELLLAPLSVGEAGKNEYRSLPMLLKSAWERAGSPGVSTLEDYLDVIEKMKRAKPTSDVGESMYGISLWQGDGEIAGHAASLAYMYGIDMQIVSQLMEINMATNEIRSILDEDSFYKRAVHFYYEANKRGLLDPDSPNQTARNVERKINSGRVLFAMDPGMTGMDTSWWNPEGKTSYMPLTAGDMKLYLEPDHVVGTEACLAVNKNSERVEDAIRLLDWLYREDTIEYLYNGPEGVVWEYGEDRIPYVTESGREILDGEGRELPGYQGSLEDGTRPFGMLGRTPASLTANGYAFSHLYWQTGNSGDENGSREDWDTVRASTAVYMTDTLPPELSSVSDKIEKAVYKAFWNMVYAEDEEEFEAIWQSLEKDADEMGMDSLTVFYKEAWNKALERAEKLEEEGSFQG